MTLSVVYAVRIRVHVSAASHKPCKRMCRHLEGRLVKNTQQSWNVAVFVSWLLLIFPLSCNKSTFPQASVCVVDGCMRARAYMSRRCAFHLLSEYHSIFERHSAQTRTYVKYFLAGVLSRTT